MSTLPHTVRIREVGPRDGFQNEPEVIPTDVKVALIDALGRTGLQRLELTSFVRPDVIPQLADAAEVLSAVRLPASVTKPRGRRGYWPFLPASGAAGMAGLEKLTGPFFAAGPVP